MSILSDGSDVDAFAKDANTYFAKVTSPARHQVVTTFVEMLDADDGGDRNNIKYIINAELHCCIREGRYSGQVVP